MRDVFILPVCTLCVLQSRNFAQFLLFFGSVFSFSDCWTHRYTLAHRGSLIKQTTGHTHYTASVLGTTQSQPFILTSDPPMNFDPKGVTKQTKNTPWEETELHFFCYSLKRLQRGNDRCFICMYVLRYTVTRCTDTNSHTFKHFLPRIHPAHRCWKRRWNSVSILSRTSGCRQASGNSFFFFFFFFLLVKVSRVKGMRKSVCI